MASKRWRRGWLNEVRALVVSVAILFQATVLRSHTSVFEVQKEQLEQEGAAEKARKEVPLPIFVG